MFRIKVCVCVVGGCFFFLCRTTTQPAGGRTFGADLTARVVRVTCFCCANECPHYAMHCICIICSTYIQHFCGPPTTNSAAQVSRGNIIAGSVETYINRNPKNINIDWLFQWICPSVCSFREHRDNITTTHICTIIVYNNCPHTKLYGSDSVACVVFMGGNYTLHGGRPPSPIKIHQVEGLWNTSLS